jgi:hypothetical protein
MKELSTEEKAKAYDEALEKARQLCAYPTTKPFINDLQDLFPELQEPEDERIKKTLINFFSKGAEYDSSTNGIKDRNIIAWLEKQGEQKQYDIDVLEKHITKDSISELAHTVIVRNGWEIVDAKEQKPAWSEEDECYMSECIGAIATKDGWSFEEKRKTKHWLKALKDRYTWKPSDEQITVLELASKYERVFTPKQIDILIGLKEQLKKLRGE